VRILNEFKFSNDIPMKQAAIEIVENLLREMKSNMGRGDRTAMYNKISKGL
jgi:hypothetical protein